jgi:hypothetical protein
MFRELIGGAETTPFVPLTPEEYQRIAARSGDAIAKRIWS